MSTITSSTSSTPPDVDIDVGPDGASVSAEGGFSTAVENSRGYGVNFGVQVNAQADVATTTENGVTTYTASADASVTVEGGVTTPRVGVDGSMTWGIRGEYSVAMPEQAATPETIANANFYDPTSMPPGTVITVRGEDYAGSELNLAFDNIAINSSVETYEGSAFIVERLEDGTVQVMTGPVEGLENASSLGLNFGVASAQLGSALSVDQARYQVANFDINTPEGLAAYNNFLATGQMPTANGDGVADVHTISTIQTDWQSTAGVSLGPLEASTVLNSGNGEYITTTYPDGSAESTASYESMDGLTTVWHQSFGPGGTEILSERRYDLVFDIPEGSDGDMLATTLNYALNGRSEEVVTAGEQVTLTFTEAEMSQLLLMASGLSQQDIDYGEVPFDELVLEYSDGQYVGNHADSRRATPWEFANNLVIGNNQWQVANLLANISTHAGEGTSGVLGERVDIDATVVADGEVVHDGLSSQIAAGEEPPGAAAGHLTPTPIPARPGIMVAV